MLRVLLTDMRKMAFATALPNRSQAKRLSWTPKREGKYPCFVSLFIGALLSLSLNFSQV